MRFRILIPLLLSCYCYTSANAQSSDSTISKIITLPHSFLSKITSKYDKLSTAIERNAEKSLKRLARQEEKLRRKLAKTDSVAAKQIFSTDANKYKDYTKKIGEKGKILNTPLGGNYFPGLDSISTALKCFDKYKNIGNIDKLPNALSSISTVHDKLQTAQQIQQFLKQRRQYLKDQIGKFGMSKNLKKLNKEVYYYSAQLQEYKSILGSPEKIEEKVLSLLRNQPVFTEFMKQNSMLAALFPNPNVSPAQAIAGLQTRNDMQALVQQKIGVGGPNIQQMVQQNLQQAHTKINELKDKVNKTGGGNSDLEIPDFKPNTQRTKAFLKRIEYGANLQFGKTNKFIPNSVDVALSAGYKLNDKSSIGIGASYKMGYGNFQYFAITHQGIGIRSYVDVKLKGSLFLSGGYEMNYLSQFHDISVLNKYDAWQKSGLIGLSKKYKISNKIKGKMQIMYDFLSQYQNPVSQPFIYRVGYTF
jgi:hypothetical protein